MKRTLNNNGFTLTEILIVVSIIALLAAIAIPNLLKAKISANDALAKSTLRSLSTASESFGTSNGGNYPSDITSLTGAVPAYLNSAYCSQNVNGYTYNCNFSSSSYVITATPLVTGKSGTTTYTITTGGLLTP